MPVAAIKPTTNGRSSLGGQVTATISQAGSRTSANGVAAVVTTTQPKSTEQC